MPRGWGLRGLGPGGHPASKGLEPRVRSQCHIPGEAGGGGAEEKHPEAPGVQRSSQGQGGRRRQEAELGWGAGQGHWGRRGWAALGPGQAQVSQGHTAADGVKDQHVIGLDVRMDQPPAVKEVQGSGQLGCYALHQQFWEALGSRREDEGQGAFGPLSFGL